MEQKIESSKFGLPGLAVCSDQIFFLGESSWSMYFLLVHSTLPAKKNGFNKYKYTFDIVQNRNVMLSQAKTMEILNI